MSGYGIECPWCGSAVSVQRVRDVWEDGTGYQTVTEWQMRYAPAGKDGQMVGMLRPVDRTVVVQSELARRFTPPDPPARGAAGCSYTLAAGALALAGFALANGLRPEGVGLVILGALVLGALRALWAAQEHHDATRWWEQRGTFARQRILHELDAGCYCHDCDQVFFPD
jgi:hypothetical protein